MSQLDDSLPDKAIECVSELAAMARKYQEQCLGYEGLLKAKFQEIERLRREAYEQEVLISGSNMQRDFFQEALEQIGGILEDEQFRLDEKLYQIGTMVDIALTKEL